MMRAMISLRNAVRPRLGFSLSPPSAPGEAGGVQSCLLLIDVRLVELELVLNALNIGLWILLPDALVAASQSAGSIVERLDAREKMLDARLGGTVVLAGSASSTEANDW